LSEARLLSMPTRSVRRTSGFVQVAQRWSISRDRSTNTSAFSGSNRRKIMSDVWLQSQIFDCVVRVEQGGALNRQPHNRWTVSPIIMEPTEVWRRPLVDPKSIEAVPKSFGAVPKSFGAVPEWIDGDRKLRSWRSELREAGFRSERSGVGAGITGAGAGAIGADGSVSGAAAEAELLLKKIRNWKRIQLSATTSLWV